MDQKPSLRFQLPARYFDGVDILTDRRCPVSGRSGCIADR
jgi:hypothetical protein